MKNGTVLLDEIRYALPEDVADIRQYTISSRDLYITIAGTLGAVGTIPESLDGAQLTENAAKITALDERRLDRRFLASWLASQFGQRQVAVLKGVGAGVPKLALFRIESIVVALPPLAEQRKIAAILSSVDDAIEATQAVIDQLQVVKKAMMAELLTRGLPGRHTKFKMTEIGEVPEEWGLCTIGALSAFVTSGSRGWAQFYADDGALFVRITNLERGSSRLDLSDRQHVRIPDGIAEGTRTRLSAGDVLISITADLGLVGLVPSNGLGEAYVNQHIALIRPDTSRVDPSYAANVLAGEVGEVQVRRLNDAGAKAGLTLPSIRQLMIPLPPLEEQRQLAAPIEQLEDRLLNERECLHGLRDLKSALMSVLLTGEVRVPPDEEPG